MFRPEDLRPLSVAVSTAAGVGLAFGLWLTLPPELSTPPSVADPQPVSQVDPNLARYRQMVAETGADATPYILAAGYGPAPPVAVDQEAVTAVRDDSADVGTDVADDGDDDLDEAPPPLPLTRPPPSTSRIAWASPAPAAPVYDVPARPRSPDQGQVWLVRPAAPVVSPSTYGPSVAVGGP
jgi:hypothetical protein